MKLSQQKPLLLLIISLIGMMLVISLAPEKSNAPAPEESLKASIVETWAEEKPCDGWIPFRNDDFFTGDQDLILEAFVVSGCDRDFVYLLDCENDSWDMSRQSDQIINGKREDAWGLCQVNRRWHAEIVNDPLFFESEDFQLEKCLELYHGGTPFSCRGDLSKAERMTFAKEQ